jgi:hypothetical protein
MKKVFRSLLTALLFAFVIAALSGFGGVKASAATISGDLDGDGTDETIVYDTEDTDHGMQLSFLTINGTVKVTLADNYTPALGDKFTLWTASNNFSGTPSYDLPDLPDGLYWEVAELTGTTGMLAVTDQPSGIGHIAADSEVDCEVYTLSGMQVATFQTAKANAAVAARQHGLQTGTYVLKMRDGHRAETMKLIVR